MDPIGSSLAVNGKTVTKGIPTRPAVEQIRAQMEEDKRFRELTQSLVKGERKHLRCAVAATRRLAAIKKLARAAEVRGESAEELCALPGRQRVREPHLAALQGPARRMLLAWAARLIEKGQHADTSDRRDSPVRCRWVHAARYGDRRNKRVHSALGELERERVYYHCRQLVNLLA